MANVAPVPTTPPSGTIAFLFTDIEGSTRLWEEQPDAMRSSLAAHDALFRELVQKADGYIFATGGDGFAAAFARPSDAADVATALRDGLAALATPVGLRVRAGIHVGEAEERDGNYFGPTLNRAARIMGAGHGGQILLSSAARELLADHPCRSLGHHRLKDLSSATEIHQLGDGEFPPLVTLDRRAHNLPVRSGDLIGRGELLARVAATCRDERLVTLTGVGGTGKTSLALAAAAELVDEFPDGVWFVDLVPVESPDRLIAAVAEAAGVRTKSYDVAELAELTSAREMLVLLDNCEHVIDDVAELVEELTDGGSLRVLATSREPLEVAAERVVPVPPLEIPAEVDGPSSAVDLFLARADGLGVAVTAEDLPAVRSICRHLDGVPLAIELAASQLTHMRPGDIEQRLDQRFELLTRGGRGRRRRHRSLEGVLTETWALLDADERRLLAALTVFPSVFDHDAVDAAFGEVVTAPSAVLRGLVDKALVSTVDRTDGSAAFRLLETVKLFAARDASDEQLATDLDRFATSMVQQVAAASPEDRLTSIPFVKWWLGRYDDLRRAERRCIEAGRIDDAVLVCSSGGSAWYGNTSGQAVDGLHRIDRLLARDDVTVEHRAALRLAGALAAMGARRPERMFSDAQLAVELHEQAGSEVGLARSLLLLSWTVGLSDLDAAVELLERSEDVARSVGARHVADDSAGYRPVFLALAGRTTEAIEEYEQLLDRAPGADRIGYTTLSLGWHLCVVERPDLADRVRDAVLAHQAAAGVDPLLGSTELWSTLALRALLRAADLAVDDALALVRRARSSALRTGTDDGLPDLLLVPALVAYRLGEHARCARYLGGLKASPKLTQNFGPTLLYRSLRSAVGLPDDLKSLRETDAVYAEAEAWLAEVADGA